LEKIRLFVGGWIGYCLSRDPCCYEDVLRHLSKAVLKDNLVLRDAFKLRPGEESLSWRVKRAPLDTDEGLSVYAASHGKTKNGKTKYRGLAALTYWALVRLGVLLKHDPEPEVNPSSGLKNPYFHLHYSSKGIESEDVMTALAHSARVLRPPDL